MTTTPIISVAWFEATKRIILQRAVVSSPTDGAIGAVEQLFVQASNSANFFFCWSDFAHLFLLMRFLLIFFLSMRFFARFFFCPWYFCQFFQLMKCLLMRFLPEWDFFCPWDFCKPLTLSLRDQLDGDLVNGITLCKCFKVELLFRREWRTCCWKWRRFLCRPISVSATSHCLQILSKSYPAALHNAQYKAAMLANLFPHWWSRSSHSPIYLFYEFVFQKPWNKSYGTRRTWKICFLLRFSQRGGKIINCLCSTLSSQKWKAHFLLDWFHGWMCFKIVNMGQSESAPVQYHTWLPTNPFIHTWAGFSHQYYWCVYNIFKS